MPSNNGHTSAAAEGQSQSTAVIEQARRKFEAAQDYFRLKDFQKAIVVYERVRQMTGLPPKVYLACLFNIGQANIKLRRFATAILYFETYLKSNEISEKNRAWAQGLLEKAKRAVGVNSSAGRQTANLQGPGSYQGELRLGPDKRLYRWVEGFDGLGNPVGFWDWIEKGKKAWRQLKEGIRARLADSILNNANITLATAHVSGVNDNATVRQNVQDTANGSSASRSNYQNAPGGVVKLDNRMLAAINKLAQTYSFSISEIAGGSHSKHSLHYDGVAFDVNVLNGQHVNATHPDVAQFKQGCRDAGATEVLGPGDAGHATHIHCAWSRP